MFYGDADTDADGDQETGALSWVENNEDDAFAVMRRVRGPDGYSSGGTDGLTPLSGLVSLHSLPELDVFGGLSIF